MEIITCFRALVGHLPHTVAKDLVSVHIALLKFLDYLAFTLFLVLNMHDGVVKVRVKALSYGLYGLNSEAL